MSLQRASKDAAFRRIALGLVVSNLLVIAGATLYPIPNQAALSAATPLLCLVCGQQGGQDVVLNFLLFIPLAVGLRLLGWPWIRVLAVSGLVSFTVEALQFSVITGRDASLSDLVTNTAGGAVGAAVAPFLRDAVDPSPRSARVLLLGGAAAVLALQGISAWLLSPATIPGEMESRWANSAAGRHPFFGQVRSVRLDGAPMPPFAAVPDGAAVRERLNHGSVTLELEAITGPVATDRRSIYMVQVGSGSLLDLDQYNRDVYFSVPARALRFRLQPPTLRLENGFPSDSGHAIHISAGERDRRLWLGSSYGTIRRSFELNLSPSHAWSMIIPIGFALGPETRLLTAIWLASFLAPLGFWAGRVGSGRLGWVTVAGTLVLGLGVLPAVSGYPPVHWSEWLAGALGSMAGWSLYLLGRYLQTRCASPSSNAYSSS